jgi:Zn-dependent protease
MSSGYGGRRLIAGLPREAFRPSGLFLCILALFVTSGWMTWAAFGAVRLDVFLFVASGWVVSLCLHEYAHALTAYKAGDVGVVQRGYLTLNPLKYTNPLLSIILPLIFVILGGFGLPGGAVWVDHQYIRGRLKDSLISLAGPGMNVLFSLILIAPFAFGADTLNHIEFWGALAFLAFLQVTASVLNLMPIPGVDGGNALRPWLRTNGSAASTSSRRGACWSSSCCCGTRASTTCSSAWYSRSPTHSDCPSTCTRSAGTCSGSGTDECSGTDELGAGRGNRRRQASAGPSGVRR